MELAENTIYLDLAESCVLDDTRKFRRLVNAGCNIDADIPWLCCPIGSKKCRVLRRTPLMIAAIYRSERVVKYILISGLVNVDKPSPSDGATAVECAYDAMSSPGIIIDLLRSARKNQPSNMDQNSGKYELESANAKFMMFTYKAEFCKKGCKVHNYGKCPYLHPKEKGRRDVKKHFYLPYYYYFDRHKNCGKGNRCRFSHAKMEKLYHPYTYRTQDCSNGSSCERTFCPYAHNTEERRHHEFYDNLIEDEKHKIQSRIKADNDWPSMMDDILIEDEKHKIQSQIKAADDWPSMMDDILLEVRRLKKD